MAQIVIHGTVKSKTENLSYATVLLLSLDSTLVKGTITDSTGRFTVEPVYTGHYLLSASMVGYGKFISSPISVRQDNIIMPDIILEEVNTTLDELTISAEKQVFDQKTDRLVFNLESSITTSGNTLLEVIQKIPGIVVNRQTNTISMNGKSGVRIMINDKIIQLPLEVVVQMLEGMSASNAKKIEIISMPMARHDADANAGIIHIVTREESVEGTGGSVALTVGSRWAETLGGAVSLHHGAENFSWFIDYSFQRNHNLHTLQMDRTFRGPEFTEIGLINSARENVTNQQNLNGGLRWKLSKRTTFSALLTAYKRDWNLDALAYDNYAIRPDSISTTIMDVRESNVWQSVTAAVGFQTSFINKDKINVNFDYLRYHNDNPSSYAVDSDLDGITSIQLEKTTPINIFVATADYRHKTSTALEWEIGVKAVTSTLDNNVLVQRNVNEQWIVDATFTSYATLSEWILAEFISAKWTMNKDWEIYGGLRYEFTNTSIISPSQGEIVERKYGFLFPSFSAKKHFTKEKELQFSFARKITRPTYNDIAPYVFFWGRRSFSAGNTALYPGLANVITASYHVKQWTTSLQYTSGRREIVQMQPELDDQLNLMYKSQNLSVSKTIAFNNAYATPVNVWWEVQSNMTLFYQTTKTDHLVNNVEIDAFTLNASVTNVFKLPKNFSIEVSGMYQSKSISGISKFLPTGALNMGVQKKIGEKSVLQFSIDDVFGTNNWRIETISPENNIDTYFDYHWHNRFIRLTYTYNIGRLNVGRMKINSGAEDERKRVSN